MFNHLTRTHERPFSDVFHTRMDLVLKNVDGVALSVLVFA